MYVYIHSETFTDDEGRRCRLYTVGYYNPQGEFIPENDYNDKEEAAKRVAYLNGRNSKT